MPRPRTTSPRSRSDCSDWTSGTGTGRSPWRSPSSGPRASTPSPSPSGGGSSWESWPPVATLYAPYVFQSTVLRRGAVPEALGLALVPWLLLAVWRLWVAETPRQAVAWGVAAALLGGAEILAHNLTAVLAAGGAVVWVGTCSSGAAIRSAGAG